MQMTAHNIVYLTAIASIFRPDTEVAAAHNSDASTRRKHYTIRRPAGPVRI